jgi:hypothetical protein
VKVIPFLSKNIIYIKPPVVIKVIRYCTVFWDSLETKSTTVTMGVPLEQGLMVTISMVLRVAMEIRPVNIRTVTRSWFSPGRWREWGWYR